MKFCVLPAEYYYDTGETIMILHHAIRDGAIACHNRNMSHPDHYSTMTEGHRFILMPFV